jgi:hypothetical protein
LLAHGRWFSPGSPASYTTKTGRHDIAEILLKVALKHQKSINQTKEDIRRAYEYIYIEIKSFEITVIYRNPMLCVVDISI